MEYYKRVKRVLGNHMCSMHRETYQMKSMLCQCSLHMNVDHLALQTGSRVAIPVRRKKMTVMMMRRMNREIMTFAETFFSNDWSPPTCFGALINRSLKRPCLVFSRLNTRPRIKRGSWKTPQTFRRRVTLARSAAKETSLWYENP